jgi:hypothetical protein
MGAITYNLSTPEGRKAQKYAAEKAKRDNIRSQRDYDAMARKDRRAAKQYYGRKAAPKKSKAKQTGLVEWF